MAALAKSALRDDEIKVNLFASISSQSMMHIAEETGR